MIINSTCRDCGGRLLVAGSDTVHPMCTPRPTKIERLTAEWLRAVLNNDVDSEATLFAQIEELDTRPPRLLDAALRYASWGWPVFPLRAKSKQPATRHGFKDATTDVHRVQKWWTDHPDHNIGLPTGHAFDVIDIDVPHGVPSYAQLLDDDLIPEVHGRVATSSGGLHLYIEPTGDGNKAGLMPGIDYRGVGGYVVAPPSTLGERARTWSWINTPSPTLTAQIEQAV